MTGHGTVNRYITHKCRCELCRSAWARYHHAWMHADPERLRRHAERERARWHAAQVSRKSGARPGKIGAIDGPGVAPTTPAPADTY